MESSAQFTRFHTNTCRLKDRFDYWRSLHPRIQLERADPTDKHDFNAELVRCVGDDGTVFGFTSADDTIAHFAQTDGEFLLLSSTVSGVASIEMSNAPKQSLGPGPELVVIDGSRPMAIRTSDHSHLHLVLPLDTVRAEVASEDWPPRDGIAVIPVEGLVPFLIGHMQLMARYGAALDPESAGQALKAMKLLALGVLNQTKAREIALSGKPSADAIQIAAMRYIALNIRRFDLTVDKVAAAVGCSRAQLYRVFEGRGVPIGEAIRSERLIVAKRMLEADARLPIKTIAHECGFRSVESFRRVFRSNVGMTPSQFQTRDSV